MFTNIFLKPFYSFCNFLKNRQTESVWLKKEGEKETAFLFNFVKKKFLSSKKTGHIFQLHFLSHSPLSQFYEKKFFSHIDCVTHWLCRTWTCASPKPDNSIFFANMSFFCFFTSLDSLHAKTTLLYYSLSFPLPLSFSHTLSLYEIFTLTLIQSPSFFLSLSLSISHT
jgi:hypothetical protein